VHVLATADETSYEQEVPMGDHPIIWINPHYDRAVYIGIGHDTTACTDPNFTILMRDAILWAASAVKIKSGSIPDFKALVLTECGGQHEGFVVGALEWLTKLAAEKNFEIREIKHANEINERMISEYKLFRICS
jgi:hypothetical protein